VGLAEESVGYWQRAACRTDRKFERHFRAPPPVLSTGFNVLIPPRVGSDEAPSAPRSGLGALALARGATGADRAGALRPDERLAPRHHEGVRPRPRRIALAPSGPVQGAGSAASLRCKKEATPGYGKGQAAR
jgi:hypothetical protein